MQLHWPQASMSDSKRTKQQKDTFEECTLEEHISKRRRALVNDRMDVPILLKDAESMRQVATKMGRHFQKRKRVDLLHEAVEMEKEAALLKLDRRLCNCEAI